MSAAVVLLSGGLDSATTAAIARSEGFDVHALSVDYGQRHRFELDAARRVAESMGIADHRVVGIDLARFGGSALTADIAVPKSRSTDEMTASIPVTYVPARNTVLLSLALGAKTFKLKFGHRGANQPVMNEQTGAVEITSQNHGFAVAEDSLPAEVEVTHRNLNDNTIEGIRHTRLPAFSVQYHPEASAGPHDSAYLFKRFREMMAAN